jgi:hypothetical protein
LNDSLSVNVPSPRRSNSTGDISTNQANPFLNTEGSGSGGGYNTSGFSQPTATTSTDFFSSNSNSTFNRDANQARITVSEFIIS